jgi:UDP-3-O-[3-hydroxymyristoyl] N-acetylglucosamine deacetylase
MSFHKQKTLKKEVCFQGVGLHSGKLANLKVKPANPNFGIVFVRTDLVKNNQIIAHFNNVSSAVLCTTITNEYGAKISTLEHLMGALFGLGIDNALIEIDSEEVPILDGSAKVFVNKFLKVGLEISDAPIKVIRINRKIEFKDGNKFISIEPAKVNLEIDFELKYKNKFIGTQRNILKVYEDDLSDVFNSRTFCLFEDIENLRKIGLAKGGSLDNAIVVKGEAILNTDGLRNDKEFVNHKILDCMGDIYLSGYKIIGKIICSQGGHKLTNQLMRKVFESKENFEIFEISEKNIPHLLANRQLLRSIA